MLFTKEEYKDRLKKTQKMMQEKGIELLISHDTNNLNYLTGYDAWSFYYAQCAIVHVNAEEPLCFVRAQDAGGAYIKSYLKNENIIVHFVLKAIMVQTTKASHNTAHVANSFNHHGDLGESYFDDIRTVFFCQGL